MFYKCVAPALLGILLSSVAFAGPDGMVKEIDVTIDLPAVTNPAAALRYGNIAMDLKAAMLARLTDRIAEEGMRVTVDISEVELSNSFQEDLGLGDTRLVGAVKVSDENDNSHFDAYELTVNVEKLRTYYPAELDLTTLTASSDAYYTAMVDAFADGVVERLVE